MSAPLPRPILTFYRRDGCHLCDEARDALPAALEERAASGEPIPHVREVDVDSDPELRARYGERIPVIALENEELALMVDTRSIRRLLERNAVTQRG